MSVRARIILTFWFKERELQMFCLMHYPRLRSGKPSQDFTTSIEAYIDLKLCKLCNPFIQILTFKSIWTVISFKNQIKTKQSLFFIFGTARNVCILWGQCKMNLYFLIITNVAYIDKSLLLVTLILPFMLPYYSFLLKVKIH